MADTFKLTGDYTTSRGGSPSGIPQFASPIAETLTLAQKAATRIVLSVDTAVAVDFCGLSNAHVVVLKTIGGKVRARFTSADGADQAVPVDTFMAVITQSVPFTAMDLTRVSGRSTTVEVFLGEKG